MTSEEDPLTTIFCLISIKVIASTQTEILETIPIGDCDTALRQALVNDLALSTSEKTHDLTVSSHWLKVQGHLPNRVTRLYQIQSIEVK